MKFLPLKRIRLFMTFNLKSTMNSQCCDIDKMQRALDASDAELLCGGLLIVSDDYILECQNLYL